MQQQRIPMFMFCSIRTKRKNLKNLGFLYNTIIIKIDFSVPQTTIFVCFHVMNIPGAEKQANVLVTENIELMSNFESNCLKLIKY